MKLSKSELPQKEILRKISAGHKRVKDWTHLHALLESMRDSHWLFRGVSSPNHFPIPAIGRESLFGHYKRAQEERLFVEFKNRAVSIMHDPRLNDWDWLAYAQHIGVPTRLLDWTVNPLVAAFFALESDSDSDRVIYAVKYSKFIHEVDQKGLSPFENNREGRFSAPLIFDRIRAQRGVFTIHPDPTKVFYRSTMKTILIEKDLVKGFRRRLFKYGIDHWHIYPDFQGLGRQMTWQLRERVGLGSVFMSNATQPR